MQEINIFVARNALACLRKVRTCAHMVRDRIDFPAYGMISIVEWISIGESIHLT